jgi:dTDP-4-dehydrorhamnose reductase
MGLEKDHFEKILIFGAQGQLGKALVELSEPTQSIAVTRREADLSQPEDCLRVLEHAQPGIVINAAAYTQVDLAEKEEHLARKINAETPGKMAHWCASRQIPFIHFSTDYVFSGEGTAPWNESSPIAPINTYGITKAEGEERVTAAGGKFLIFRTSWVYDKQGKNFLNTMLRLGGTHETIKVVQDQVGAPTFAPDLAYAVCASLRSALKLDSFPSGIYHLCNSGETSWFEFAEAIFHTARSLHVPLQVKKVLPILSQEYPTPARRPKNSRLNTQKVQSTFGIQMPHWRVSLEKCMRGEK